MSKLRPFAERIWTAEGPVVSFYGFAYPTRMAVIRLENNDLFVWSPIPLDGALSDEVRALGPVAHLVSPNSLHHFWLVEWKRAFRAARLHAPPGLARKRKDIAFDSELADQPDPAWAGEVEQAVFSGSFYMPEIAFLHRPSRTAIFGDLIQNFPRDWYRGWKGVVARFGGIVEPDHGTPIDYRWSFIRRASARAALQRILAGAPERVIIAHGTMAERDGAAFIRHGLRWLMK